MFQFHSLLSLHSGYWLFILGFNLIALYSSLFAQTGSVMHVRTTDNNITDFNISDIDSIWFTPCTVKPACDNVTDHDGNVYNAIMIGTQCWIQLDLKTTSFNDGSAIQNVTVDSSWMALTSPGYCWYNDSVKYKTPYGALYNWYAVNTGKLCPAGWHVPSHDEWSTLERAVCTSSTCLTDFPMDTTTFGSRGTDEGGILKEAGTAHWYSPNTGTTNSSGFTALPVGQRTHTLSSYFEAIHLYGIYWSVTPLNGKFAWVREFDYQDAQSFREGLVKYSGLASPLPEKLKTGMSSL